MLRVQLRLKELKDQSGGKQCRYLLYAELAERAHIKIEQRFMLRLSLVFWVG